MNSNDSEIQSLLPLREPTLYILASLANGEKHGYAIIKAIESLSAGRIRLSTGTLYEALARLVEQGLIERVDALYLDPDHPQDDADQRSRTRKAYRLTRLGLQVLKVETDRMQVLITMLRSRLGEEPF